MRFLFYKKKEKKFKLKFVSELFIGFCYLKSFELDSVLGLIGSCQQKPDHVWIEIFKLDYRKLVYKII